jgi:hypothetical protein
MARTKTRAKDEGAVARAKAQEKARDKRLEVRRLVEGALVVLEEYPQRQRKLLKRVSSLAHELADVFSDAEERSMSLKVRGAAIAVRGVAALPASMRSAILRKVASKALGSTKK